MHRLLEHNVYHLRSCRPRLPSKIPSGSVIIVAVRPKIPHLLRDNLALSLFLLLVFFNPFVLVNQILELKYIGNGFPVKDFLKPCSTGRPSLSVLKATSSKLPSISLKISQYLSKYVFRVSPSFMDKDNKEAKGRGTLLHVMKWDPNA